MTQDERRTLFEPDPSFAHVVRPEPQPDPAPEPDAGTETVALEPEAPALASRERNPWIIALWVAAGVLVALPLYLYPEALRNQYFGYGYINADNELPVAFAWNAVVVEFGPVVVGIGLACALAATCFHAAGWMRRRA